MMGAAANEGIVALLAALTKAQAMAVEVDKASKNTHHGYKYASAEALMSEATRCLGEHGLAVICIGWKLDDAGERVSVEYLLTHENGGTLGPMFFVEPVIPGKGRPLDKALATALTYCQGYALRGILNLPRVDADAEVDSRDDSNYQHRGQSSRRPPENFGRSGGSSVAAMLSICEQVADLTGETMWQVYNAAYKRAGGTLDRSPNAKDLPPAALAKVHAAAREILAGSIRAETDEPIPDDDAPPGFE